MVYNPAMACLAASAFCVLSAAKAHGQFHGYVPLATVDGTDLPMLHVDNVLKQNGVGAFVAGSHKRTEPTPWAATFQGGLDELN